jgi:hypothetical protein
LNEEEKRRPKKKERKYNFETIKRGVCCQICYDEDELTKECKLLNFFVRYANIMTIILISVLAKQCSKDVI